MLYMTRATFCLLPLNVPYLLTIRQLKLTNDAFWVVPSPKPPGNPGVGLMLYVSQLCARGHFNEQQYWGLLLHHRGLSCVRRYTRCLRIDCNYLTIQRTSSSLIFLMDEGSRLAMV